MFRLRTAAAVTALAALVTTVPLTAAPAVAAAPGPPAELVVPPRLYGDAPAAQLRAVGSTGFLRGGDRGMVWTRYDGTDGTPVDLRGATSVYGTGTDVVGFAYPGPAGTPGRIVLRDMTSGAEETLSVPAGQRLLGVFDRGLLTEVGIDTRRNVLHRITLEDGVQKDVPVSGLPDTDSMVRGVNGHGALLHVRQTDGTRWLAWLDDRGTAHRLDAPSGTGTYFALRGDWVISWAGSDIRVLDTRDLTKPARVVPEIPDTVNAVGVAGGELLMAVKGPRVVAVPLAGGGAPRTLFTSAGPAVAGNDGRVLVPRRGDGSEVSVQELAADAGGKAVPGRSWRVPPVAMDVVRMTLENGRLHTAGSLPWTGRSQTLSRLDLLADGELKPGQWEDRETREGLVPACTPADCPELLAPGDGRLVTADGYTLRLKEPDGRRESRSEDGVEIDPRSVRAVAYAVSAPVLNEIRYVNLDAFGGGTGKMKAVSGQPFALAGAVLWTADWSDTVKAVDLRTGKTLAARVPLGHCGLEELDARGTSLYWKCAGAAGVYDTATRTSVRLPAHRSARLGDGFIGWEQGGVLKLTDLRGGTGTRTIGRPARIQPGQGWSVDASAGLIAYADAAGAVHVVPSGVPAAPLSVLDAKAASHFEWSGSPEQRVFSWWLSRPAAGWRLTIRSRTTGAVVRTYDGGAARSLVRVLWDGQDTSGRLVRNGTYTWTLTATPADGQGPALTATGSTTLSYAAEVRRDHAGQDGLGDLLTLNSSGGLTFHRGNGAGGFAGKLSGAGWPLTSRPVPFGDLDGDRCNDLLVRNAAGELRAYLPWCGQAVTPATRSRAIGTGWGQYDVLTSPGDLTGDGRADLVVRKTSTGDVYLYAANGTGAFRPAVRIQLNWKLYRSVFGAGDLNGDGVGDLLAVDGSNAVWRYDGVATGTVKPRVRVKDNGWAAGRNAFVGVGDVTGDGRPDVVSRNAAGDLLLNKGTSTAGLSATTRITTGFGAYKGLF
ncbi:FG-GAP-like repeat-containing protein [Streptomyces sp. NPDC086023]|uniref:FG-GAP-like repeat-containing protein n=1 Tax=Streptomyces sp. NPDC086023 TaxID=3365746 RepID=UPI0037D09092